MVCSCLLLLAAAPPLTAQAAPDTAPRAGELRGRIEKRFGTRVKEELGLTDAQAARLKPIARAYGGRRRELRHRERDLREALDGQLRAGAAADQDSVARLTRDLLDLRIAYAEAWREEMTKLAEFLTPVQRAQLLVMRERLLQRVHEMRDDHRGFRRHRDAH
jgi:Spy/CpxP family protein refolding chaperone